MLENSAEQRWYVIQMLLYFALMMSSKHGLFTTNDKMTQIIYKRKVKLQIEIEKKRQSKPLYTMGI